MITNEIKAKAKYFEGEVPDNWTFLGITRNGENGKETRRDRYYETPDGEYYFVPQQIKRRREPRINTWERDGYTFGKRDFRRQMYVPRRY